MYQGKYVFSQIMESVVRYQFNQCVARYHGDYWVKNFSCWEQFLALAFGQLSFRESLRDIVVCLGAHRDKLYHIGFRSVVARNTLAHANEKRDWRIYRDLTELLIGEARKLYVNDQSFDLDLDGVVYVIDSTIIDLCLNLFPWARLVKVRAALKLNIAMDLKGSLPSFFHISSGKTHDLEFLDILEYEHGAYYVMDRGYIDYGRLYKIHQAGAFFVTRAKHNFSFRRLYSNKVDKSSGVKCDQVVVLAGWRVAKDYPEKLRRIKYFDDETNRQYVFLTNDFVLDALTIAQLYKYRWQVELFFKWIKQHLSIKAFWGRSANAVKMQICIALRAYLLFDKIPLTTLISEFQLQIIETPFQKQLKLWDY